MRAVLLWPPLRNEAHNAQGHTAAQSLTPQRSMGSGMSGLRQGSAPGIAGT